MQTYLTTEQLATRIQYDVRTIRDRLKDSVLLEGIHYIRPFGGRKLLFLWEAIERDIATLKGIRFSIETRHTQQDKAYLRITPVTLAKIQHVEGELKDAMPYAVCPVCQGVEGGCKCCTDGFQSEDQWKVTPERMKAIKR